MRSACVCLKSVDFEVDRGSGVESFQSPICVYSVDEFIEVGEPEGCVLIIKVPPQCPHDIAPLCLSRLSLCSGDKRVDESVEVIARERFVVLDRRGP
jgi:hypothetical protein